VRDLFDTASIVSYCLFCIVLVIVLAGLVLDNLPAVVDFIHHFVR
jgi:hypothetical protein